MEIITDALGWKFFEYIYLSKTKIKRSLNYHTSSHLICDIISVMSAIELGVGDDMLSYKKLWKLLIDKDLSKKQLAELAGVSQYTVNKLNRGETVITETLVKICIALKCDIGDICEVIING